MKAGQIQSMSRQSRRLAVRLMAAILIVASVILIGTDYLSSGVRQRAVDNAIKDSKNIAYLVRANFERVIESIDLQIDEFLREYNGTQSEEQIRDFFKSRRYPAAVVQVGVSDAAGTLIASNLQYPVEKISLADREHFRVHADAKVDGVFISKPVRGRVSGLWTLNITRAAKDSEGRFVGMVVFSYDLRDFARFYDRLSLTNRGTVSLTGLDGFVRFRSGAVDFTGLDISQTPSFQEIARKREGRYQSASVIDGVERIGYFTTSDILPFLFLVSYDKEKVLSEASFSEVLIWSFSAISVLILAVGAVLIYRDWSVSERLREEEVQRLIERRNSALLDAVRSIPGLIMAVVASDGTILASNLAAEEPPTGSTLHISACANRLDIVTRIHAYAAQVTRNAGTAPPLHTVDHFVGKDGQEYEILWAAEKFSVPQGFYPADEIGDGRGFILIGIDNTSRRRQEAKIIHMSKLATLGEVATGMAHELNQPLNVIRLAADNALARAAIDAEAADYIRSKLERIVAQVERASTVINHMRIFGRRSNESEKEHDPWTAVEGALTILRKQLETSGVTIKLHGRSGICQIKCEQALLEQVIMNLMVNARDAILARPVANGGQRDAGWIEISLKTEACADGKTIALLRVSDNGGGIPENILPRLFEPFFTTKPAGKGTGLGLSVSYGIISDLGGRLSAANDADGATFEINLPCVVAQQALVPVA